MVTLPKNAKNSRLPSTKHLTHTEAVLGRIIEMGDGISELDWLTLVVGGSLRKGGTTRCETDTLLLLLGWQSNWGGDDLSTAV